MTDVGNRLLILGCGYSGRAIGGQFRLAGWRVKGTTRSADGAERLRAAAIEPLIFDGRAPSAEVSGALASATHVVASIGPDAKGDPVLMHHLEDMRKASRLQWIGYLSTVGVYGNHDGAWVDEDSAPRPVSERSIRRIGAEQAWRDLGRTCGIPVQVFRLSGIYGPGRSPFDKLRTGTARRLIKSGQVFNRIHVDDIAGAVLAAAASLNEPPSGLGTSAPGPLLRNLIFSNVIFNVTDDLPAPPQDVIAYAADLLGVAAPPEIPFESAALSPMARSFYGENKRVRNDRMKHALGYRLRYPTYREGLRSLLADAVPTEASRNAGKQP